MFYAIGNIGDSKKTDNTRVNDPSDPKEFVVEIMDNTFPNSIFPTGVVDVRGNMVYPISKSQWKAGNEKYDSLYNNWDGSYEFRYEISGISKDQRAENTQVWRDMYEWVITATDEEFVNEFDHWFIKDAATYFYLFTERYTMMDNRAKNTFWHYGKVFNSPQFDGDNGYRFDFWDYDNDTSLGIDNQGELVFTYGREDIDYRDDGDPSSGFVFNGAESVFFRRIRKLMHSDLAAMYQGRETAGAWSDTGLINEFDNWQEEFPEALWILDYKRKYERTYRGTSFDNSIPGGISDGFLSGMMNGKKKYHRRQYERDQFIYMGTKYISNEIKSNLMSFRCNTPEGDNIVVPPDYTLRIVPYSDMYITVLFGASAEHKQVRAKAGQTYEIPCPFNQMTNTQILIYAASRIQALNDISACYIEHNDFSKATKLQKLVIGNTTPGYSNNFLKLLALGDNPLLEELDIRNCPKLTGSINLSNSTNLKKFYAEGTAITGIIFAKNGKIELAHLPDTVNSVVMINLMYLNDLKASFNNLEILTIENSIVDTLGIITDTVDTVTNLRLVGINWTLSTTELLNQMLEINTSYVSGIVTVTGAIRNQEILRYSEAWPDLIVNYRPENIVPQFVATYVNADANHTVLYTVYVDQNTAPPDPYATGKIEKPTLESDEQFDYSFGSEIDGSYISGSGWDNITEPMFGDRTIIAVYSTTIRKYTVSWFISKGDSIPYDSVTVEYGKAATLAKTRPTITQDNHLFKVFTGWDKSTGFIRGDLNVYAVWDSKTIPPVGTELKDMSIAEILAVTKSGRTTEYFESKDYIDVTLGHDYNFSNIEDVVIAENEYFNGSTARRTEYKLLGADSGSFTLAIDLRFINGSNSDATILSCFEFNNNIGLRIRLSGEALNIQWGNVNTSVSCKNYRDMIVLRHRKGERQLYVYTSTAHQTGSASLSKHFNLDSVFSTTKPRRIVLTSNSDISTESPLTLGGIIYTDGTYSQYGTGMIYWCKLWFDDIGNENCEQLSSWHHETLRMEFYGSNKYQLANTGIFCNASFVANNLLEDRDIRMILNNNISSNYSSSNVRDFFNERLFPALPVGWQSIIKEVTIDVTPTSSNTGTIETFYSNEYIYIPSRSEINGEIPFMESKEKRVKFNRFIIPPTASYYNSSTDPQTDTDIDVNLGDIWTPSGTSITYMLISKDEINKYGLTVKEGTAITNLGGWVASSKYWTRTMGSWSNTCISVSQDGNFEETYANSSYTFSKLLPCWSI